MGNKKGQPSKAFLEGKMDKYNFKNLPVERRKEIAANAAKKRKENAKKRKEAKEQLEMLLSMDVKSPESKKKLKMLGIDTSNMDNQMLLLATLFNKGKNGDTMAIKQIFDMIEKDKKDEKVSVKPVINIIGVNSDNINIDTNSDIELEDEEEWEND